MGLVGRRRRAVRPDDRRVVVAVAEHHAVGEPFVPHDGGEPVAVFLARGVVGRARRENLRAGQALAGRQHAAKIAARLRDVAQADRPPLGVVGAQELRAAPALHHGLELPAEIDRVADAGVHAEAAGRRHQMGGVAGDEDAVGAVAVGDQLAPHPAHDGEDFVVEVAAHGALERRADVVLGMVDLLRRADDRHAEAVGAVDRDDGEPDALRADEDEAVAFALVVQLGKVRAAEHHVGGVGQRRRAAHGDAELLAHRAGAAVGADHVVGFDGFGLAGLGVAHPRADAVRRFGERDELAVVAQRGVRRPLREAPQDRIEHVLRHALALLRAFGRAGLEAAAGKRLAAQLIAVQSGDVDVVLRIVERVGRVADPVEDAPAAAELHGADADEVHLRLLDGAVGLLDQGAGHAAPAELAGEREADRPAADDQHRRARTHLYLRSMAWNDAMSTRR